MDLTMVILAAGMSSRYGRLKQLDPLGPRGEAILDYTLHDGVLAGFRRFVLVIRPELEGAFREHLQARVGKGVEILFAHQRIEGLPRGTPIPEARTRPWGTGHAVLAARPHVPGPFAVANADDFYGRRSIALLGRFLADPQSWALVGYVLERTLSPHGGVSRGICSVDGNGWLRGIREVKGVARKSDGSVTGVPLGGEETVLSAMAETSMNLWGFTPDVFPILDERLRGFLEREGSEDPDAEFVLPEVVETAIRSGRARVRVLPTTDRWIGVTFPEDHGQAAAALRRLHDEGVYAEDLAQALLERTST
jgi:NDP-sugar pyrophosphorylase family protein